MSEDIFNLSFNNRKIFILSVIPALINLGIFIYASVFLIQNRTNRVFSVFVLLLGIAQLTDGLIHMSNSAETAMTWGRVSLVPWVFISPAGLLFTLKFSMWDKKISGSLLFSMLFLPAILFELIIAARLDRYTVVKSENWGWIVNPESTFATNAIYVWITGIAFLMLFFLWLYYIKETNPNKKRPAFLLAAGFTFPFVGGVIAEMIFPLVLKLDSIPITTPLITAFSVSTIIAIKKYSMLDYSPRHQWRTIIETMNEGILIVDNFDKIMYANKTFCQLVGYEFYEIKGKVAHELFLENEYQGLIQNAIEERKSEKSSQYEIQFKTKNGKKVWILMNGSPYLDRKGSIVGSIGVQTNITRLKELEKTLEYSNSRLKAAQTIAHIGSWELDFATNIAVWSDEACRIYGLSLKENTQSFERWLSFIHPEDLFFAQNEIEKSQATHTDWSFKHRIIVNDGTIKHIHSISRFEFDAMGIPVGLVGICHDITEQRKAELALVESEARIRNFAAHLNNTIENERAYIAREIHDEFGQYLAGIKLGLSSLQKLFSGNDKIDRRIIGMISDIDNGQQSVRKIATKLRPGILDTLGLIQSIIWLLKEFEKKTDIKYQLKIDDGAEEMYRSDIAICYFRICQEALTNISKHAEATEVITKIQRTKNELILIISDNGKGISNEKLENPFSMGLLGMRERANLIGANLQIESKKNAGTTIQLEFKIN